MVNVLRFDTVAACAPWQPIDDRVMGGLSSSRLRFDEAGWAVFEGEVSLQNQGGFASVRAGMRAGMRALARQGVAGYGLTVRGDGRSYKFSVRTETSFDGMSYQASFQPAVDSWSEITVLVASMRPTLRGRLVPRAPRLQPERVCQLGWMVADGKAGPFALAIRQVTVF